MAMETTAMLTAKLMTKRKKRSQRMMARSRRSPKRREMAKTVRNPRTPTVKMEPRGLILRILPTMRVRRRTATL
jgi:hypothetical protein